MHTVGNRRSGRVVLIAVVIVLVLAIAVIVWERNVRATTPPAPPMKQRTNSTVPAVPDARQIWVTWRGLLPGPACRDRSAMIAGVPADRNPPLRSSKSGAKARLSSGAA